jgi:hypothetical protein
VSLLLIDDSFVSIYDKDRLIAQHQRSYQKHHLIENPDHVKGLLASRPKATFFKYRDILLALDDVARRYFEAMTATNLNIPHHLKKIVDLIELYGKTDVLAAMEHALTYQALGHEYLLNIILANRRKRSLPQSPDAPSSKVDPDLIRSTWVEERDLTICDTHFNPEDNDNEDRES